MSHHGMNSNRPSRNSNFNEPSLGPEYGPLDASHGGSGGYDSIRTPSFPVLPAQKYEQLDTLNGGYEIPKGYDHTYEVPIQSTYLELQADGVKSSNIKAEDPSVHHVVPLPLPRHVEHAEANNDDKSIPASTLHCCQGTCHSKTCLAVLIAILVLVILGLVGALVGVSVKPNQQDQNNATNPTFSLDQYTATTPTYPPADKTSSSSPVLSTIAFEVVRTTNSVQQQQLFLGNVLINDGSAFQNGLFEAPADGVYCFHFTVGIPENKTCNASMTTNNISTSVIKTRGSIGLDTLARFDLFPLSSRQQVITTLHDEQQVYSSSLLETSWLGFRLDNIMSPFVATSAGSSRSVAMAANVDELAFNEIFIDTHKGWNEQMGCYTIPVSGYYFITYQASSLSNNTQVICIRVNGYLATIDWNAECVSMEASSNVMSQTIGASVFVYLRESDNVSVECTYPTQGNCLLYSDNSYQVSMSAFLYQPAVGSVVAWSVARLNLFAFGEINPLEFNTVLVNEGFGWNQFEQQFVCPEAGVYYVYLMGHANSGPLQLTVMHNDNPLATLRNDNPQSNFFTVRSRALLIKLSENDKVHISLTGGTYMVFFIGFKLY